MLYFKMNEHNEATAVVATHEEAEALPGRTISRHDIVDFDQALWIGFHLQVNTGLVFLAIDKGESVHPRFDVIKPPVVGDEVSFGFNGDYYPCGTVTSVSKSYKVIHTSDGKRFYRRKQSGSWIQARGTWSLVKGHHDERNQSF